MTLLDNFDDHRWILIKRSSVGPVYMTFNGCVSTADRVAAGSSRPITCTAKEDFWYTVRSERVCPVDERSSAQHCWLVRFRSWRRWRSVRQDTKEKKRADEATRLARVICVADRTSSESSVPVNLSVRRVQSIQSSGASLVSVDGVPSPIHSWVGRPAGAMIYQRTCRRRLAGRIFLVDGTASCRPKQRRKS